MRPIIGISCPWSEETWGETTVRGYDYAGRAYGDAIYGAGGMPVLIPAIPAAGELSEYARELLESVDGLYFTGGGNVKRKPGEVIPALYEQQPTRAAWEDALLKEAYRKGTPCLGVCRGYQMMAMAFGGAMDTVRLPEHKQTCPSDQPIHTVSIVSGSLLEKLVGGEDWFVNSIHVERVGRVPEGFQAVAYASDGSIEALAALDKPFFMGTQFHPELMPREERSQKIFRGFIAAAAEHRKG